jgi:hypothetical protein
MVKKPLNAASGFRGIAKRVGEVCALSCPMVGSPRRLRISTVEATVSKGDWVSRRAGDLTGTIVELPRRAARDTARADAGDDDATVLAQQLSEQVREYRMPQPQGAGAKVVWLFR